MNLRITYLLLAVFLLSSCSFMTDDKGVFRDRKKDYRKAENIDRITVPEGMQTREMVDHYPIPPISPYADEQMYDEPPLPTGITVQNQEMVRVQKLAGKQWILVQMTASQLWPMLRRFIHNQPLELKLESGSAGVMEAVGDDGVYRFRAQSGLQHHTTELSIRFLDPQSAGQGFWQAESSDKEKETAMLMELAGYIADIAEEPAYSFAAQNLNSEPRLLVEYDDKGQKYLRLDVDRIRAIATLRTALERAELIEQDYDEQKQVFTVRYMPALPDDKKPGFIKRLLGFKAPPFDRDVEYAGHYYRLQVDGDPAGDYQRIRIFPAGERDQSQARWLKEANQQILRVSRLLY